MKYFLLLTFIIIATNSFAQTAWQEKVVGNWKYEGTEEFGVVTPPDSTQKNNKLQINADGTFSSLEKGKECKGTYKIDEASKTMTMKDSAGKSKLYYLKKSDPGVLIIESQTPDLIRTRHRYSAAR